MSTHRVPRFILLAAGCFAVQAQAQMDSFSLNFEEIKIEYHSTQTGSLPFALDLVHGEDGAVRLRPIGTHNLTFKRGQFFPADPLPESWLYFDMDSTRNGMAGQLAVGIDQSAGAAGGGPHVKVFDGRGGSSAGVHAGGAQVLMGDGSVRFVRDSVNVQLRGEPTALFNQPGPGEPLVAQLPTPAVGQTIRLKLVVTDNHGASTSLPVQISRPR